MNYDACSFKISAFECVLNSVTISLIFIALGSIVSTFPSLYVTLRDAAVLSLRVVSTLVALACLADSLRRRDRNILVDLADDLVNGLNDACT